MTLSLALMGCATRPPPEPLPGPPAGPPGRPADPVAEPLVGGCGPAPISLEPKYTLPYAVGDAYPLSQGNCGSPSHSGRFSHAFDFRMPMRTPVVASRDGVVDLVRSVRPDGTGLAGDENLVILDHGDGEFSRYVHLTTDGVLVREGDRVTRGDTIGLSGNSGPSRFPHLHFDVVDRCGREGCRTIPSAFLNARPPIPGARTPVLALPYPSDGSGGPR